ncbi:hypothetical protein KUTeg_000579 [Tegillarca granosa]|uniref:PiggyBac transposable element-derived protein domain-containing protein n=1 Tax=Tegillarca granosa TaxID=220873 RepID=A0ABQ9G2A3_TEGGR|nr:hypothetical protein KUTeg_000579 [Tegillarca granosa]
MDVAEALRRVLNSDYEDDSFESEEDNDENNEINQSRNNESDISVSEPEESSGNSSSDEVQVNIPDIQTWSHNLKKPNVKEFTNTYGCTFELGPEKKELDFFLKFFPSTLIEKLVMETNSYAEKTNATARKPDQGWVPTTFIEMMAFLGIHLIFSVIGDMHPENIWTPPDRQLTYLC